MIATPLAPRAEAPAACCDTATTVVEALRLRAEETGGRIGFTVVTEDGDRRDLTYRELFRRARRVAFTLRARGLCQGERVVISLPDRHDFLRAFFGVMLAGGVAVPIYPPEAAQRLARWRERLAAIVRVAQPSMAIVSPAGYLTARAVLEAESEGSRTLLPHRLEGAEEAPWLEVLREDLAFLQFTSGTTELPRGVAVTQTNLLENARSLVRGLPLLPDDISVSWLPFHHDMGLVGHVIVPLVAGLRQVLTPPLRTRESPFTWLKLISEVRATQTTAPNFAYALCTRRLGAEQRAQLDLSSLRLTLDGAELVQHDTLERFSAAFASQGFDPRSFRPVYGLAEATLAACISDESGPRVDWIDRASFVAHGRAVARAPHEQGAIAFVSVGRPVPGHELEVLQADGRPCASREIGEIRFRGPTVATGYFNDPIATARTFRDGWLYTGDLGYLHEGELYVTGRRKELVIKNGSNFSPQDIESAAASVPGVRAGRVVALGLPNLSTGTEDLVVVAELATRRGIDRRLLAPRVAEAIQLRVGLRADRVELVPPGSLPKTTSGKLQRGRVAQLVAEGTLPRPAQDSRLGRLLGGGLAAAELAQTRLRRLLGWR